MDLGCDSIKLLLEGRFSCFEVPELGLILRVGLVHGLQLWLEHVILYVLLAQDHLLVLVDLGPDAFEFLRPLFVDFILLNFLLVELLLNQLRVKLQFYLLCQFQEVGDHVGFER